MCLSGKAGRKSRICFGGSCMHFISLTFMVWSSVVSLRHMLKRRLDQHCLVGQKGPLVHMGVTSFLALKLGGSLGRFFTGNLAT